MQQSNEQNISALTWKSIGVWLPYVILITSVVTVIGIFALSSWAETAGWHHAAQHALIFGSGLGVGGSLFSIHKKKKEQ